MDTILNHKFIVFGGDGVNALGVVRSLGEVGIRPYVIRENPTTHFPHVDTSKYVEKTFFAENSQQVLDILLKNFSDEPLKPIVFFTDEFHTELFDSYYDQLKDKFVCYNAGKSNALIKLLDKSYQCALAKECGISVPKYEVVDKGVLPANVPYPIITKTITSNDGRWKRDMIVCKDESELLEAYKEIVADRLLVEEYIDASHEVDLKGFSILGGEQIFFTHLKRWNYKDASNGHMMYFEPCEDERLKEQVSKLIKRANYSGIFDAEFIQDKQGNLYFLEVNWRTGMYNYNHILEGINLPYLWAKAMIKGYIDEQEIHVNNRKYTALCELTSFSDVLRHPTDVFSWIKEMKQADVLYYYNKSDIKPCIAAWKGFFSRKFSHLLKRRS